MHTTIITIHYRGHLIVKEEDSKYSWRGKVFDSDLEAFKAIDDKISLYNLKTK